MRHLKWAALGAAVAVAPGCVLKVTSDHQIQGSGTAKAETRAVGDFRAVYVGGATDAVIEVGPKASLRIETDDNLLSNVIAEVRNGTLEVRYKEPASTRLGLKVWITVPALEAVDCSGASSVDVKGLRADRFAVDCSGASKVVLKGRAKELAVDLSGASDLDAGGLESEVVEVDASGASRAKVRASRRLAGEASGASAIEYAGDPREVEVETNGASHLRKI